MREKQVDRSSIFAFLTFVNMLLDLCVTETTLGKVYDDMKNPLFVAIESPLLMFRTCLILDLCSVSLFDYYFFLQLKPKGKIFHVLLVSPWFKTWSS